MHLHVIFLAETDPGLRQWQIYKKEIRFSYEVLASWRKRIGSYNALLNQGTSRALAAAHPDVILCGGYNYLASWQALLWARLHHIPFFLWSESNLRDARGGGAIVGLLKSEFLRECEGFVVPGKAALEYLRTLGVKESAIFTAVNAVDNGLFAASAESARQDAARHRAQLGLPSRYFLFAGRLVREKGVFELLSAYAKLETSVRQEIGLVLVGDGSCRGQLEEQARRISPGVIVIPGFAQREQLAVYYALGDILILPTYTDTWGLVVNEAMACGLPVILSEAAGCAADLVTENWNGCIVPPGEVSSLTSAMRKLANQPNLCAAMGVNSKKRISNYSPDAWSMGISRMVESVGACRD